MKFYKFKCKVCCTCVRVRHEYRLEETLESSPSEEDLDVLVDKELGMSQQCALRNPERQIHPGLHPKQRGQHIEEGDSTPLLCTQGAPPGVLGPGLGSSTQKKT